jgi:hypothetical protein
MAKKLKLKSGDIFSLEVAKNEFIYGRIVFDVTNQYMKTVYPINQGKGIKNYFDFFNECFLVETFLGVHKSLEHVDLDKKAVQGTFVSGNFYKASFFAQRKFTVVSNKAVDPKKVSFPETLSAYDPNYYFACGELYLPILIDESTYYDEIKVMASFDMGYWTIIVATLDISQREDLIEEGDNKKINYFRWSDIKSLPEIRNRVYHLVGENPNQSYYEMALKYGFDLARLYNE